MSFFFHSPFYFDKLHWYFAYCLILQLVTTVEVTFGMPFSEMGHKMIHNILRSGNQTLTTSFESQPLQTTTTSQTPQRLTQHLNERTFFDGSLPSATCCRFVLAIDTCFAIHNIGGN